MVITMTDKTDKPQPTTAAELREAGLFKISAQIDIELYKAFKNACTNHGLKVKSQIEVAMLRHLHLLDPEACYRVSDRIKETGKVITFRGKVVEDIAKWSEE